MDPRVERLDPAVEHLREAGDGGDVGDRQARRRAAPAPCRRSRRARSRARRGRGRTSTRPVLSETERSARRGSGAAPPRRSTSIVTRRPSAAIDRAPARSSATARGSSRCSTAWIRSWSVASSSPARIGDGLLGDDRAAVERRVDEVDGRAGDARRRAASASRTACAPGNAGSSDGWVLRIRPANAASTARPDDAHVAGEDDDVGRARRARASREGVVGRRPGRAPCRSPAPPPSRAPGRPDRRRRGRSRRRARRAPPPRASARRLRARRPRRRPRSGRVTAIRPAPPRSARRRARSRGDDLADDAASRPASAAAPSIVASTAAGGDHDDHPEPAVERRPQLVVVEPAERADQPHDRRHPPASPDRARAPRSAGSARGTLPGSPPPVMWASPAQVVAGRAQRRPQRRAGARA